MRRINRGIRIYVEALLDLFLEGVSRRCMSQLGWFASLWSARFSLLQA